MNDCVEAVPRLTYLLLLKSFNVVEVLTLPPLALAADGARIGGAFVRARARRALPVRRCAQFHARLDHCSRLVLGDPREVLVPPLPLEAVGTAAHIENLLRRRCVLLQELSRELSELERDQDGKNLRRGGRLDAGGMRTFEIALNACRRCSGVQRRRWTGRRGR